MSGRYRVTPRAVKDLQVIARELADMWGAERRNVCLTNLEQHFQDLADRPEAGRTRVDVGDGVRSHPCGALMVFFRVDAEAIDIIGVTYKTMSGDGGFGPG